MYAWIVSYRRNAFEEFSVSSEAYWSMEEAEAFVESRSNNPKPPFDCCGVPRYLYKTDTGEEYRITVIHLPKKKEV